jgi:hypothetical protein
VELGAVEQSRRRRWQPGRRRPQHRDGDACGRAAAPGCHSYTAGQVYAPSGAAAGSTVMVWVNQAGQLTDPPLQTSQVASRAVLDETLAVAALAIMLIAVGRLGHWALDKRRLAAWGADWLATGPRWSSRR